MGRCRGIYLAVMAVPLFLSVTLLLSLKVDLLTGDAQDLVGDHVYVNNVLKMQQMLNRINVLDTANDAVDGLDGGSNSLLFDCNSLNAIHSLKGSDTDSNNPISRRTGIYGFTKVQVVQVIAKNCRHNKSTEGICLIISNNQILKEAVTFIQLRHTALAKLLGICSSIDQNNAIYVTEAGPPVNITYLKTLNFTSRLQIVSQVISLIGNLHHSSLGHLTLRSVDNSTFAWINGLIKLKDISGLAADNTACSAHSDCRIEGSSAGYKSIGVKCRKGICVGLQSLITLKRVIAFLKPLLHEPIEKTAEHQKVNRIISQIEHLNIDAGEATKQLKDLLQSMKTQQSTKGSIVRDGSVKKVKSLDSGLENWQNMDVLYWPGGPDEYKFQRTGNMNIASQYDYVCPRSLVAGICQLSVNTITQALTRCTGDPQCRAFVLTQNKHQVGSLSVILKSGVGDLQHKEESSVYVKVPINTEHIRMSPDGDLQMTFQSDNTVRCPVEVSPSAKKDRERRHTHLMKLIDIHGLSEAEWIESVKNDKITNFTILPNEMTTKQAGLRMQANVDGIAESAIFNNGEKPNHSHLSHLLFYHLDRILGLHRVLPTVLRSLDKQELEMMSKSQPKLRRKLQAALRGNASINVVITPDVNSLTLSRQPLSIRPLQQFPSKSNKLSGNERSQLEYLVLLWLSGTPRDHMYTSVKGEAVHILTMDGFQQGVDNLLPYFHHCQFPKSMVEYLLSVANSTKESCSISSQLLYRLKLEGIAERDILNGFHSVNNLMLLVDKAVEKFLEILQKCFQVLGNNSVLY